MAGSSSAPLPDYAAIIEELPPKKSTAASS